MIFGKLRQDGKDAAEKIDTALMGKQRRQKHIAIEMTNVNGETDLNHEATYIWIDSKECIRCGECVRICPTSAITIRKTELCGCSTEELEEKQKDNQPYGSGPHFKY